MRGSQLKKDNLHIRCRRCYKKTSCTLSLNFKTGRSVQHRHFIIFASYFLRLKGTSLIYTGNTWFEIYMQQLISAALVCFIQELALVPLWYLEHVRYFPLTFPQYFFSLVLISLLLILLLLSSGLPYFAQYCLCLLCYVDKLWIEIQFSLQISLHAFPFSLFCCL